MSTAPAHSILFERPEEREALTGAVEPAFFRDLGLDRVVTATLAGRDEYRLAPYFWLPQTSMEAIRYRQEALRDLEDERLAGAVGAFAERMHALRRHRSDARRLHYAIEVQHCTLEAARSYLDAVDGLTAALTDLRPASEALAGLREHLERLTRGEAYRTLAAATRETEEALAGLRYCIRIHGDRVTVTPYTDEADYRAEVLATFERFRQGEADSYLVDFLDEFGMNHVEAQILQLVTRLEPRPFALLEAFAAEHGDFLDATVAVFDREAQFALAVLEQARRLRGEGLETCYPRLDADDKGEEVAGAFDLALALGDDRGGPVTTGGYALRGRERILVVTGPNQSGKTTLSRTVGQLHHLARLGVPVPAARARLHHVDRIFTHYEREEDASLRHGKLEDDLLRIHDILAEASGDSLIVMNEIFASTTLADAITLGTAVLRRLIARDTLAVCVTFVDEFSRLGEETVSLVGAVDPETRAPTYVFERREADGLAYAAKLAEQHGLDYASLRKELAS